VREHFWSNDFLRSLQNKDIRKSIQSGKGSQYRVGIFRTFEDLPVAQPYKIFDQNGAANQNNFEQGLQ
jgi:hypothetical protein